MADQNDTSRAGGALLAASIVGGSAIGVAMGQPSIGFLAGTGVGLALLVGVWLLGKRRRS